MSSYIHNPALLRLPFDQYGRYQIVREALDAARPLLGERLRILDVGGFFRTGRGEEILPARSFLPQDDVTVLDQPASTLPGYVQGDGRKLKCADAAFDFVISCDTLEHVPAADRPAFWDELVRAARYGVLLAAPFASPEVLAAESLLFRYIKAELGVEQIQLKEHYTYGLPELGGLRDMLDSRELRYHIYPSGYVHAWLFMMVVKHYLLGRSDDYDLHEQVDAYYTRFFAESERCEPAYRHLLLVACHGHEAWLEAADAALAPTIHAPYHTDSRWPELAAWLFQLVNMSVGEKRLQPLLHTLAAQEATIKSQNEIIQAQQRALHEREAQIRDLEQRAAWLAEQSHAARRALAAVEQGLLMRLLRRWR